MCINVFKIYVCTIPLCKITQLLISIYKLSICKFLKFLKLLSQHELLKVPKCVLICQNQGFLLPVSDPDLLVRYQVLRYLNEQHKRGLFDKLARGVATLFLSPLAERKLVQLVRNHKALSWTGNRWNIHYSQASFKSSWTERLQYKKEPLLQD